jgi:hypothetical protein
MTVEEVHFSITIKDKNGTEKSKPIPNGIILRWVDDEEHPEVDWK